MLFDLEISRGARLGRQRPKNTGANVLDATAFGAEDMVMGVALFLVTPMGTAEMKLSYQICISQDSERTINGAQADLGKHPAGSLINLVRVRMPTDVADRIQDDPPLAGHAEATAGQPCRDVL